MKPCPDLDDETIRKICVEYRMACADIVIKKPSAMDEFIDAMEGNRTYIPCLYILNKID